MVFDNAYTPDEARRALSGEDIVVAESVYFRLKAEIDQSVYQGKQLNAVARLVRAWEANDHEWFAYMISKKRYAAQVGVYDVHERIDRFSFWVRLLALCPSFSGEYYAAVLAHDGARIAEQVAA